MTDAVLRLGDALVQHGPSSDRVYLMRLGDDPLPALLEQLEALAEAEGYGKIFAKVRGSDFGWMSLHGYRLEALVPGFFDDGEPCAFMSRFLDPHRAESTAVPMLREVLGAALEQPRLERAPEVAGVTVREATPDDLGEVARCYGSVFESYPFPIQDRQHLEAEALRGTRFFVAHKGGRLVAVSSMEPGGANGVVEMTDFATLPQYRGRGLASRLLWTMDEQARTAGTRLAYTIARASSYGMNITFARQGYRYGGTLVNNTQISGSIESMNVWFKAFGAQ
ncbi:MAG: putative beta-lysine N-acetyltransferase [Gemmatimonadota bacterium]